MSSGLADPSSTTRTASFSSGMRMRLTMKPGVSRQAMGVFPILYEAVGRVEHVVRGERSADDLDQREHGSGIEEVEADDALGPP
jgi:hypothetical protein